MNKPIRGSEVFWETALDIFEHKKKWCCFAISENAGYKLHNHNLVKESKVFTSLFKPQLGYNNSWMTSHDTGDYQTRQDENREHRVWAMLFMEVIWKDEYE